MTPEIARKFSLTNILSEAELAEKGTVSETMLATLVEFSKEQTALLLEIKAQNAEALALVKKTLGVE